MSDALDLAEINQHLNTQWLGRSLEILEQTDSTMNEARAAAQKGKPLGHVVLAECQSAGRGARGRTWESPRGEDLYFSFVHHESDRNDSEASDPDITGIQIRVPRIPLTLIVGLGLQRALSNLAPHANVEIKWPNDVLVNGRKCAGILAEARTSAQGSDMIVGIGVNINRTQFSEALQSIATSLHQELGGKLKRNQVMAHLLNELEQEINASGWREPQLLQSEINSHLAWRGRKVQVDSNIGEIIRVNLSGELELLTDQGIVACQSGQVQLVVS